jgi:hypothetical protein
LTDSAGTYSLAGLPASSAYTLKMISEDFRVWTKRPIDLGTDATLQVNAELLPE